MQYKFDVPLNDHSLFKDKKFIMDSSFGPDTEFRPRFPMPIFFFSNTFKT